jgi:lipopolysaccharide/colanic/teichoic acid biosynthesis glycosyltransferase
LGRDWRLFSIALAATDVLCFLAGPALAGLLGAQPALGSHHRDRYWQMALLFAPVYVIVFLSQGLYDRRNLRGGAREYALFFQACALGLAVIILLDFLFRLYLSRQWIILGAILTTVLAATARLALRRVADYLRRRGHFTSRAIVIGADTDGLAVAAKLNEPGSGIQVVGLLDDYVPVGTELRPGLRVLDAPSALRQVALREGAQDAILVPQALPWETLQKLIANVALAPNSVRVHLAAGFYDLLASNVAPSELNGVPLLTVSKARLGGFEAGVKVAVDYVLATILLTLFAPALALTALRVRLSGSRNVLERRSVLGRGGRTFSQLSFPASAQVAGDFVLKLPGLVNVLLGQLSLVGPRPIPAEKAADTIEERITLTIRPGLTGPWRQVDDPADQALMDLYYIRSYSIWLDLQVLAMRVVARIKPQSAARGARVRIEREKGLSQLTRLI